MLNGTKRLYHITIAILFIYEDVLFGIDPRAASATRALLRLIPCYQVYLRPCKNAETSGTPSSLELTGGEYKTRERIHRGMLIRDY